MKPIFFFSLLFLATSVSANIWSYQVNVNGQAGKTKMMNSSKSTFEAGTYDCEVSPLVVKNETEYRTLLCTMGSGTVSTGGLCTRKGAKFPSVQYAILNLSGPKSHVNVVVACKFE
jgi:hypothetical protein